MWVATVEGLVTLFYDGSKELFNELLHREWVDMSEQIYNFAKDGWEDWNLSDECKRYWRERQSWQQVIIEEGVTEIPRKSFHSCRNIRRVIMANTVVRIKIWAFGECPSLIYIKWSINIEVIESIAFCGCGLTSVFIPPRCREIGSGAFRDNYNLTLFHVHPNVQLGRRLLSKTKLMKDSHFELDRWGNYEEMEEAHEWVKNINNDGKYSLHRACCSFRPLKEVLVTIIRNQGIRAFKIQNDMGITPSRYLKENPYTEIKEMEIIRHFTMTMMGELE